MRKVLYSGAGEPQHYLTGSGVLYTLQNAPVGLLVEAQLVNRKGRVVAWFDGEYVWDASGVLAFVKGARPERLELPETKPLRIKPAPTAAPFYPLLHHVAAPENPWVWSPTTLEDVLSGVATV